MTRVAIETLNAWGSAWAGAMYRSVVEGTALLVIVGLAWLLLRRRASSAFLHGLFLLVLIKVALPIALPYTLSVSVPWPLSGVIQEKSIASTQRPQPPTLTRTVEPIIPGSLVSEVRAIPSDWSPSLLAAGIEPTVASSPKPSLTAWLMLAWAVVVASLLARFVTAHVRMARRLREARRIDPDELPVDLVHLAALAGLWRLVTIAETNCVVAPAVWGLVRPQLLVPPGLIKTLPTDQLTWAFLHELVHVRRGDCWVLLFQRLIQIIFFFNPAVWFANRSADVLREFACDDASLALAGVERHECGAGFLAIAERACQRRPIPAPITLGLFGSSALIHKRLERILDDDRPLPTRLSWRAVALLGVVAVGVLPVVRAQAPAPQPSRTAGQVAPTSKVDSKTGILELVVVDGKMGTPLKDAVVTAMVDGTATEGKTNANGRFTLNVPEREPKSVRIQVRMEGYVIASVERKQNGEVGSRQPAVYTFAMERGATIGGLAKDSAGRPIAGVLVHVVSKGKGGDADIQEHTHKTDATGRWQCSEVPSDLSKTWFRFEHADFARMTLDPVQPTVTNFDHKRFQRAIGELLRTETELIEAESQLTVLEQALRTKKEETGDERASADAERAALIEVEFKKDPEVIALIGEISEARDHLEKTKDKLRRSDDPSLAAVSRKIKKLVDQYENLWTIKYDEIRRRLKGVPSTDTSLAAVDVLRQKVAALKLRKEKQTQIFEQLKFKNKE